MGASRRLNLTVPPSLFYGLRREAGQRRLRAPELARRLLQEGLQRLDELEMESRLREAYRTLASEERRLLREFQHVDAEGWEES